MEIGANWMIRGKVLYKHKMSVQRCTRTSVYPMNYCIPDGLIHRVGIFAEGPEVVGEDGRAEEAKFTRLIQGVISIQLEI
jgi:hypothetical protein